MYTIHILFYSLKHQFHSGTKHLVLIQSTNGAKLGNSGFPQIQDGSTSGNDPCVKVMYQILRFFAKCTITLNILC